MRSTVVLASLGLVAGLATATTSPAQAAAAPTPSALAGAVGLTAAEASAAQTAGSPLSSLPASSSLPAALGVIGELTGLRTASSDTYATSSGRRVTRLFVSPVNYQPLGSGPWASINPTLIGSTSGGHAWRNTAGPVDVELPATLGAGSAGISVTSGSQSISMNPTTSVSSGVGAVSGDSDVFSSVWPATTVSYTSEDDVLKETLQLASNAAPSSFTSSVELGAGESLTPDGSGGLRALDNAGRLVFELPAPSISDSAGQTGPVTMTATQTAGGWTVTVTPDAGWLGATGRAWPVTVDPSVAFNEVQGDPDAGYPAGDCTIVNGPSGNGCDTGVVTVGSNGSGAGSSALLSFGPSMSGSPIPASATVLDAQLGLQSEGSTAGGSVTFTVAALSRPFNYGASWTKASGSTNWTTPGGDRQPTCGDEGATVADSQTGLFSSATQTFYVRCAVQGWVNGTIPNDGLVMSQSDLNDAHGTDYYGAGSNYPPTLTVLWSAPLGGDAASRALDPTETMAYNVASGNLTVTSKDYQASENGDGLSLTRTYNSYNTATGQLGYGWTLNQGPDVHVTWEKATLASGQVEDRGFAYYDSTGTAWLYEPYNGAYKAPSGVNADLAYQSSSNTVTITDHQSNTVQTFVPDTSQPGSGNYVLSTTVDRNGNTILDGYSSAGVWNTVQSYRAGDSASQGREWDVTHTSGRVTAISEANFAGGFNINTSGRVSRSLTFGYDSSHTYLTSYEDPDTAITYGTGSYVTAYNYDSAGQLTQVITPNDNTTKIAWHGSEPMPASSTAVTNVSNGTGPVTTYTAGQNLLTNLSALLPGGSTAGWNQGTAASINAVSDNNYVSGGYDLNVNLGSSNTATVTTTSGQGAVPVIAGQTYNVWAAPNVKGDGYGNVYTGLVYYRSDGSTLQTSLGQADPVSAGSPNLPVTATVTAPGGAAFAAVAIQVTLSDTTSQLTIAVPRLFYNWNYGSPNYHGLPYTPSGACAGTTSAVSGAGFDQAVGSSLVTDANGNVTTYCYDDNGNVTTALDGLGHVRSTSYTYNQDVSTLTDALAAPGVTTATYDTAVNSQTGIATNNLTGVKSQTGASGSFGYSNGQSMGKLTCNTSQTGNPYLPKCATDTQGNMSTASYNTAGNQTGSTDPMNNNSSTQYNPDGTVSQNATTGGTCTGNPATANHCTTYAYNYTSQGGIDLLSSVVTTPTAPLAASTANYDVDGRITSSTDGKGQTTYTCYDNDDRPTYVSTSSTLNCANGSGATQSYSYNLDGTLAQNAKPGVNTTDYDYDPMGRLVGEYDTSSSSNCTSSSYNGNMNATSCVTLDGDGNVLAYTDAGGTTTYRYDAANNNTAVGEPGAALNGSGQPTCTVGTGANPAETIAARCTAMSYNNNGFKTDTLYPSGELVTATADASGRTANITGTVNGTTLANLTYSYAVPSYASNTALASGSDTNVVWTITGTVYGQAQNHQYNYNADNELTADNTTTYTYDTYGQLTTGPSGPIGYNNAGEPCLAGASNCAGTNNTNTAFDADGNDINVGSYTSLNQTVSATASTGYSNSNITYTDVNQDSRLSDTTTPPSGGGSSYTTTFTNTLFGLSSAATPSGTDYYTRAADGTILSLRHGPGTTSTNYYYLHDRNGSTLLLNDPNGNTAATYTYDAWGNTTGTGGSVASENPWRWDAGYTDPTGLIHFSARYYNPAYGAWTQTDPSGQNVGYAYAGNNPINAVDSDGLFQIYLSYSDTLSVAFGANIAGILVAFLPVPAARAIAAGLELAGLVLEYAVFAHNACLEIQVDTFEGVPYRDYPEFYSPCSRRSYEHGSL